MRLGHRESLVLAVQQWRVVVPQCSFVACKCGGLLRAHGERLQVVLIGPTPVRQDRWLMLDDSTGFLGDLWQYQAQPTSTYSKPKGVLYQPRFPARPAEQAPE